MDKVSFKKKAGIFIDAAMYALLLIQMLYIFTGNTLHEILGVSFFVCLVLHCVQKRRWLPSLIKKKSSKPSMNRSSKNVQ